MARRVCFCKVLTNMNNEIDVVHFCVHNEFGGDINSLSWSSSATGSFRECPLYVYMQWVFDTNSCEIFCLTGVDVKIGSRIYLLTDRDVSSKGLIVCMPG